MNEQQLIQRIAAANWYHVKAMVAPLVPDKLLDVVFETTLGDLRLTGRAYCVQGISDEVFGIAVYEHTRGGWWTETDGETKWTPRNLTEEWRSQEIEAIGTAPRTVRYFTHALFERIEATSSDLLAKCKAIEFTKHHSGGHIQMVFFASDECPCALEIGTTPERCAGLLAGLKEVSLH